MPQRRLLILGGVLVALGLLGIATVPGTGWWPDSGPRMGPMMWMMGSSGLDQSTPPPRIVGGETVEVRATEFRFDPDRIVVTTGESVNIRLVDDGVVFHDLFIPELGFNLRAEPGQEVTGGLTVPTPGVYSFRCTVPGHADGGMIGALVAEEGTPRG